MELFEDEIQELVRELEYIRRKAPYSKLELARTVGISFNTLERVLDRDNPRKITLKTIRLIKEFIKNHGQKYDRI